MRRILSYIIFILVQLSIHAQSKVAEDYYVSAFNEMSDMLLGRVSNNNKEYISYEFGFSKINSVYIVKNDTYFDVYISDGDKLNISTKCESSPILNWAFEKAPNESSPVRFVMNKEYEPLYYKLTIMANGTPIIIDSSSMRIIGNEAVVEKIDELKRFILSLWIDSLESQNSD